jgi:hypothetical protein|tara:strand:- start:142 stop:405 length:264 start_codon:yes stop_codon:yes gene_type:complete
VKSCVWTARNFLFEVRLWATFKGSERGERGLFVLEDEFKNSDEGVASILHVRIETPFLFPEEAEECVLGRSHGRDSLVDILLMFGDD